MDRMSFRLRKISYLAVVDIVVLEVAAPAVVEPRSQADEERFVEFVAKSVADILLLLKNFRSQNSI